MWHAKPSSAAHCQQLSEQNGWLQKTIRVNYPSMEERRGGGGESVCLGIHS